MVIGSLIGAVGSIAGGLFGRKKSQRSKTERVPIYSPEQMAFQSQMLENSKYGMNKSMEYLNSIMNDDPATMGAFESPYKRQFEEQTIPGIAERFAGLNAQGSSAFGQSLSQAGAGLSENLAALRANLKGQAMAQLQQFAGIGLTPQYNTVYQPGQSADNSSVGRGVGQAASIVGDYFNQPRKPDPAKISFAQRQNQKQVGNYYSGYGMGGY